MDTVKTIEVYPRDDGRFAWRAIASNGQIVASDAGQGYEHQSEAKEMALGVVSSPNYGADIVIL